MSNEDQAKFLTDKLAQNKAAFQIKAARAQRAWVLIRTAGITITGIVTIVLGLKATSWMPIDPDVTANIALILSAIATFLAAAEATFDFRWTWLSTSLTLTRIYGLEDRVNYRRASGDLTQEDLDSVFEELSEVLEGLNNKWLDRRTRNNPVSKTGAS